MSGLFGISTIENCTEILFYGTDYHSHLANNYGGLAVFNEEITSKIHDIRQGQFKSKFFNEYRAMEGNKGIGVISHEIQPVRMSSRLGEFAVATDGLLTNIDDLVQNLLHKGVSFSNTKNGRFNQTELVGKLICEKEDFIKGIEHVYQEVKGSLSLIVLTKNGVYASSDRFPLTIGSSDKGYAVASETTAFSNLGFRSVKQLAPGEIVLFNEQGIVEQSGLTRQKQTCLFLWVYTSFPSSTFEHLNVEISRERCGAMLAKRDSIEADFVTGVPDSGIAHGVGYAIEKKIPFRRALQKYTPGWGRSYIPSDQIERDIIAHYKIIPIPEMIRGKDIILTEDSIVRGTQLRKLLKEKIWPHEPRSIHVRVACPPLMGPCNYNVSTRKGEELIALQAINAIEGMMPSNLSVYLDSDSSKYQQMVDYVKNHIGATTLQYQRMDDLLEAIGHPDDLCVSCWKG